MFLSKKNAIYFNKPKNIDPLKPKRILAGWQDDEQEKHEDYQYQPKQQVKVQANNLLMGDDFVDLTEHKQQKKQNKQKFYLNWDELDAKDDIDCQKRLIEEIVQPGGIRIKPNDNMLSELLKQVKGMDVHIIGSLLLSKLEVNYPFQIKAKALYTIEFLIKKNEKFLSYFKAHVDKLSSFPEPEDNVQNYKKILKVVLNFIGISEPAEQEEQFKPVFVDPGYNDDPKSKISNFIQENANKTKKVEQKKVIIGPGQMKTKPQEKPAVQKNQQQLNNDFLSLDLLGTGQGSFNLMDNNQNNTNNKSNFNQFGVTPQNRNPTPAQNNVNLLF